jgi:hypothetical protein
MVPKLNIYSPSTICHAKVFSKCPPEAGSATTSVRITRDLGASGRQKTASKGINGVSEYRQFVIHQISKLGRRGDRQSLNAKNKMISVFFPVHTPSSPETYLGAMMRFMAVLTGLAASARLLIVVICTIGPIDSENQRISEF